MENWRGRVDGMDTLGSSRVTWSQMSEKWKWSSVRFIGILFYWLQMKGSDVCNLQSFCVKMLLQCTYHIIQNSNPFIYITHTYDTRKDLSHFIYNIYPIYPISMYFISRGF